MTFEMELAPEFSGGKIRRGDVVTLAYDSYSARGVPKNPKIHRIRSDVTWEQVVVDYSMKTPQSQSISGMFLLLMLSGCGRWYLEGVIVMHI